MKYDAYVASSWRNNLQPIVVERLRSAGLDIYDFRNPEPGDHGFHWSDIDPAWQEWNAARFVKALNHPIAERGYGLDMEAMQESRSCVLVLPCGRSAHLEAGWFAGAGRPLYIFQPDDIEPELMYKMATSIELGLEPIVQALLEQREG